MSGHRLGAWVIATAAVVLAVVALVLVALSWGDPLAEGYYGRATAATNVIVWLTYVGLGVLVVLRRPGHVVGWLLAGIGLGMLAIGSAIEYSVRGLVLEPGSLPVVGVLALAAQVVWIVPFTLLPLLLLVFPTGSLVGRGSRVAVGLAVAAVPAVVIGGMWALWPYRHDPTVILLGADAPGGVVPAVLFGGGLALFLVASVLGVSALVLRWRRGGQVERLQIEWLLFGAGVWAATAVADTALEGAATAAWTEWLNLAGLAAMPVAIAVAILRYRLYEIDRLISRTITYLVLSGVLAAVYVFVAVLPTVLLDLRSDVGVAAATLAVVTASGPVRHRVQRSVDRRFNRSRYDARRVIAAFGARAREDVALDDLVVRLRAAVSTTVEPSSIRLWFPQSLGRP